MLSWCPGKNINELVYVACYLGMAKNRISVRSYVDWATSLVWAIVHVVLS
jgi:hypothetical protein